MKKEMVWALVLVCNLNHINRAIDTIIQARVTGDWHDDIVLVVPQDVYDKAQVREVGLKLGIEFLVLPEENTTTLMNFWDARKEHPNYEYVSQRKFQYQKFYIMHTFFRRWTNILYIDSGVKIHGPLQRLINQYKESNVLYAHSDSYPQYEWNLERQFCVDMDAELHKELKEMYDLTTNYFQSTIMMYNTSIIQDDTVHRLFELRDKFPFSFRNDQGIFNLHFLCERKIWRQLPIADERGYLYDYHNRLPIPKEKYLLLKAYH